MSCFLVCIREDSFARSASPGFPSSTSVSSVGASARSPARLAGVRRASATCSSTSRAQFLSGSKAFGAAERCRPGATPPPASADAAALKAVEARQAHRDRFRQVNALGNDASPFTTPGIGKRCSLFDVRRSQRRVPPTRPPRRARIFSKPVKHLRALFCARKDRSVSPRRSRFEPFSVVSALSPTRRSSSAREAGEAAPGFDRRSVVVQRHERVKGQIQDFQRGGVRARDRRAHERGDASAPVRHGARVLAVARLARMPTTHSTARARVASWLERTTNGA